MLFQPPLPAKYAALTQEELADAILQRKHTLGSRVIILGHHYQQDEIVRFADFTGDRPYSRLRIRDDFSIHFR